MSDHIKKAIYYSQIAGLSSIALLNLYAYMFEFDEEGMTPDQSKMAVKDKVFEELKKELKANYSIDPPRDSEDGLPTKDFFIKFHVTLYKYKKYGQDMIS